MLNGFQWSSFCKKSHVFFRVTVGDGVTGNYRVSKIPLLVIIFSVQDDDNQKSVKQGYDSLV